MKIELNTAIGMLRQWLNENRIKDAKRFVTNDDILTWIGEAIEAEAVERENAVIKAFGGCTKCYGKGYGTGTQFIEAFPDFVGDGYSREKSDPIVFCGCDRGKQLAKIMGKTK